MNEPTDRWVLRGGEVIDGRGGPRYPADVVLAGGRIIRIVARDGGSVPAADRAAGLCVPGRLAAPGFIAMPAHSALSVLAGPAHLAKVAQGVTLEVVGEAGLGYAPVTGSVLEQVRSQIAGWNGEPDLDYS